MTIPLTLITPTGTPRHRGHIVYGSIAHKKLGIQKLVWITLQIHQILSSVFGVGFMNQFTPMIPIKRTTNEIPSIATTLSQHPFIFNLGPLIFCNITAHKTSLSKWCYQTGKGWPSYCTSEIKPSIWPHYLKETLRTVNFDKGCSEIISKNIFKE